MHRKQQWAGQYPDTVLMASMILLSTSVLAQEQATADWIPTQGNNELLASLSELTISDLSNADSALKARAVLGIIPSQQVAQYLADLNNDPAKRTLNVRWISKGAKCTVNQTSCTKAATLTVLEYSYDASDASDCQTFALVTVDTLLPRHSLLTDGGGLFIPAGSPQYIITASPNSTAGACTYVVAYPPATVQLATLSCDDACRTSPCLQCADSVDPLPADTACQAGPGISQSMQAALEGAAQCLASGAILPSGRFECDVRAPANASTCGAMQCFPGHASVKLQSGERKLMRELRVGDSVEAVSNTGQLVYSPIYFFGHRDREVRGEYVHLAVRQLEAAEGELQAAEKVLQLSPLHFVPVATKGESRRPEWSQREMRRAGSVKMGDLLWAAGVADSALELHRVVAISHSTETGAFNPYTLEGNLIVDGVLASAHSEWVLDPVFRAVVREQWLPAAYQTLYAPLRLAFHLLGPAGMRSIDGFINGGSLLEGLGWRIPLLCTAAGGVAFWLVIGDRKQAAFTA